MTELTNIRKYISELLLRKSDSAPFSDEETLITAGRLDSVDVMDIVVFLEDHYALDFAERGINIDDFDSLDAIGRMIDEMKQ